MVHTCVDEEVLQHLSLFVLRQEYEALLTRLYRADVSIDVVELHDLLQASTEIVVSIVADEQLLATVQGSVLQVLPTRLMVVSNVVTHDDYEGQGYGRQALTALEATARKRWGSASRSMKALLTNRTARGNSTFYERQGWYPLTP